MIWVISGGNFGWKSAGISTWLQNLPLLIKVWQSRMQLRLLLFANNLLMFSGFLLISSWISTMSGFWNNTKIVSWLPPMLERVFSSWSPEATWGRVYTPLPWNLDFYTRYEAEIYTRNTSWQKMLIEDVIVLVTWPTCILQTKNHFCWSQHKWKMTSSMNFFYQGKLLVKDSSWYHLQIPRYCMVVNFPYNAWSVNSDQPKTRTILHMLSCLVRGYFNFKMFVTKFCSLGQSFISITQVVLEL